MRADQPLTGRSHTFLLGGSTFKGGTKLREGIPQQEALAGPCSQVDPAANTRPAATYKVTKSTEMNFTSAR